MKRIWMAALAIPSLAIPGLRAAALPQATNEPPSSLSAPESRETRELVSLVWDAAREVHERGKAAFDDFRVADSRWRRGDRYVFVLSPKGDMLVHPDPALEGKNQLGLKDINGKPIIQGIIAAATSVRNKPEGWFHYEWPAPGGLLPRWKSTYARLVTDPAGSAYIVGSGIYTDRMERAFVVDMVRDGVSQIEKRGPAAFPSFRDRAGRFVAKDAYIFVFDRKGKNLVLPGFPNLEGRNLLDLKDTHGKKLVREMFEVVQKRGSGWVDYMWPKPGDRVSTQKSTFVTRARMGDDWVLVGCGVYLADAPRAALKTRPMTARQLMSLVRDAAAVFARKGEKAYPEFRRKGTRWYRDEVYFFALRGDGVRTLNAANRGLEGQSAVKTTDVLGRPYGKMFLAAAATPSGEGWVHYMYPQPGEIFPTWKSTFVKRVTFPSGRQHVIGCGLYNMQMDQPLIEDVVNRAATLVADHGAAAFGALRDKKGPFMFMDTYVFVDTPDGVEVVNPAQPSIEGTNLIDLRDVKGKAVVREYIAAAQELGSAWVEYYWYRPGSNTPTRKLAYVRKVQHGAETFIVGSGYYPADGEKTMSGLQKHSWETLDTVKYSDQLSRQSVYGEKGTVLRLQVKRGAKIAPHAHPNEEYCCVSSGAIRYLVDGRAVAVSAGEVLVVPPNLTHTVEVVDDADMLIFFAPGRADLMRGQDQYLRP